MTKPKNDTEHIDVRYVADLARIDLNAEEAEKLQGDMDEIIGYIEKLNELNVDGIDPTAHPIPLNNVMREDTSAPSLDREKVIENAPNSYDDAYIRVPVVIEEEGA